MRLEVDLGERSYPVVVSQDGLSALGEELTRATGARRCVLVSSRRVADLHGEAARESLSSAGVTFEELEVPDGEAHKDLGSWRRLVEDLLAVGVDRSTPVVALGGGVTGDLVGFAAATVKRGLPLVQVPTTLLAMVDSSVGGKTAVNTERGKNLVGAFYQPVLVYAAVDVLRTLPPAELRCGLGEVLKYGMIWQPEILTRCTARAKDVLAGDPELLAGLVMESCRIKAEVVAEDEREAGLRSILNFGHTVGHALETALGHGELRHGECVAIGMVAEARWAARRQERPAHEAERLVEALDALGMRWRPPPVDRDLLHAALQHDKKWSRGRLRTAVLDRLGEVHLERIARTDARLMLDELPLPQETRCEP